MRMRGPSVLLLSLRYASARVFTHSHSSHRNALRILGSVRGGATEVEQTKSATVFDPFAHLQPLDGSQLTIERTTKPKPKPAKETLKFGQTFSDHMLEVDWNNQKGWSAPKIRPYQNLQISPAASVLHYGLACFEGLKAYKDAKGAVRIFRPDLNIKRLNSSLRRLYMPTIDEATLMQLLAKLVEVDKDWIPEGDGYSLYIRPTAIGSNASLGVTASPEIKFYVILAPSGPYFAGGFKPISLYADPKYCRAWPGGMGYAKAGANYAPTIMPASEAARTTGCSQVLWLYGEDHLITEGGAMNIFLLLQKDDGSRELVTPPLGKGLILPGVTRQAVLDLLRTTEMGQGLTVSEREISMREVVEASDKGQLLEVFASGTAAVIAPVSSILYQGKTIEIAAAGMGSDATTTTAGGGGGGGGDVSVSLASQLWKALTDIQYGRVEHEWSKVVVPAPSSP